MRIIISPAKKMVENTDLLSYKSMPQFLDEANELADYMKSRTYEESKAIWKCSDAIAKTNYDRFQSMDLERGLSPAILSYEGIQYQYMAPQVLEEEALGYIGEHLRILSGLYGIVRPFDGVVPYRLEMQSKFDGFQTASLYEYWEDKLADSLLKETGLILNLASKEYSKCIEKYLPEGACFVTCTFGEVINEKVVEKGTMCKMARGEMVRFLAEKKVKDLDGVRKFDRLDYRYDSGRSDDKTIVFIKKNNSR